MSQYNCDFRGFIILGTTLVITPTITTNYSVIGTNIYGCSATAAITQSVSECIGIGSHSPDLSAKILIFPNPNNGCFKIQSEKEIQLLIINSRGLTVRKVYLNSAINLETEINYLKNGIYYLININQP